MDLMSIFKKQTAIIAVSIIGLTVILIGTSYALFFRTNQSTEQQVVSTGTLTIDIPNPQARLVDNLFPLTEEEAATEADPYSFTVRNTGTLPVKYQILLYNDADETLTNVVEHQYLNIQIDGGTIKKVSELVRTNDTADLTNENSIKYILLSNGTLNPSGQSGDSNNHSVKIWLDSNAPSSTIGKDINFEIAVNGEVNEE